MQTSLKDFQIDPSRENITIFTLYNYIINTILIELMKDALDTSIIKAFSKQVTYLTEKGFQPVLNIMDNDASKTIGLFLKKRV